MYDFPDFKFFKGKVTVVKPRLLLITAFLSFASAAFPANRDEPTTTELTVAVAECPPFVIFENGHYAGLAVYLWERIGGKMRR